MDLIAGFQELKILLDKTGLIPPLINIIVEYTKCSHCHDIKHRIVPESQIEFDYNDAAYGNYIVRVAKTDTLNIYAYTAQIHIGFATRHINNYRMHLDILAYSIAHGLLWETISAIPYHTE